MTAEVVQMAQPSDGSGHLPMHIGAERALLGSILLHNDILPVLDNAGLKADHFASDDHQAMYADMLRLRIKGAPANGHSLARMGHDPVYVAQLASEAGLAANTEYYAETLIALARERALIQLGEELREGNITDPAEVQTLLSDLLGATEENRLVSLDTAMAELLADEARARETGETFDGFATGLIDLDKAIDGLRDETLAVVGGRPAMGKTSLATCIAISAAQQGRRVAFFSLEMSRRQIAERILNDLSSTSGMKARRGELDMVDTDKRERGAQTALPIIIDDTGGQTVGSITLRCQSLGRDKPLGLVVVDHMSLMRTDHPDRAQNKVNEVAEFTSGLKNLAKSLGCPVLLVCQLNRAVENRDNKRPTMSDLRDSGAVEQDADLILFVYREEYYHKRNKPTEVDGEADWWAKQNEIAGKAEIIVAKNKFGKSDDLIGVRWLEEITAFRNAAQGGFDD